MEGAFVDLIVGAFVDLMVGALVDFGESRRKSCWEKWNRTKSAELPMHHPKLISRLSRNVPYLNLRIRPDPAIWTAHPPVTAIWKNQNESIVRKQSKWWRTRRVDLLTSLARTAAPKTARIKRIYLKEFMVKRLFDEEKRERVKADGFVEQISASCFLREMIAKIWHRWTRSLWMVRHPFNERTRTACPRWINRYTRYFWYFLENLESYKETIILGQRNSMIGQW